MPKPRRLKSTIEKNCWINCIYLYYNARILCVSVWHYKFGLWTSYKLRTGIIRTIRTWTRDFQKIFREKWPVTTLLSKDFTLLKLFYGKIFSAICFYILNAIVSFYFTQILSKSTFRKKGYATCVFSLKKL